MEIIAIVLLNLGLYWRTLKYEGVVDDLTWYRKIQKLRLLSNDIPGWIEYLRRRLYGAGTFGLSFEKDHAFAIFLNCVTATLIYLAFGQNNISFWAAILYTCNPINNQTTIWMNGRRFTINIIFVLLMMMAGPFGALLYIPTHLFQVTALFAPLLFIHKYPWMILALPLVIYLGYDKTMKKIKSRLAGIPHDKDRTVFTWKRLIVITKYYGHYIFKMPIPGKCLMTYPMLHFWGRTEAGNKDAYAFNMDFYKGAAALLVSVAGLFFFKGDMFWMWAFMCVSMMQWCAILPFVQDLADRYASLPNVFMMFFVSYLLNTYAGAFALPILTGLAVYYAVHLHIVMPMYKDFPTYWFYHRFHSPAVPSPRIFEIKDLIKVGQFDKAWVLSREGLMYTPNDFGLLQCAAQCNGAVGNLPYAKEFAEKALENCYLGQRPFQEPALKEYIERLDKGMRGVSAEQPQSRQQRRAEERKEMKTNEKNQGKS